MKYYKLSTIGVNRKEIGGSPQCEVVDIGDIQKDFMYVEDIINFDFKVPILKLYNKAIPTTIINTTAIPPIFLVVKNGFIDLLKDYKIGDFQSWPIEVIHKNQKLKDYNLFFINYGKQSEYIDFRNSEFCVSSFKDFLYVGETVNVKNYGNYESTKDVLKKNDHWLKCKSITIDLKKANEDIFILNINTAFGYYVSERLKEKMEQLNFTGMVFKEIDSNKKIKVVY